MKRCIIFVIITVLLTGFIGCSAESDITESHSTAGVSSDTSPVSGSADYTLLDPEDTYTDNIYEVPGFIEEIKNETLPVTAITVDETNDEYNIMNIGRYNNTGKTDLAITDIKVFSASKPAIENLGAFDSGDTLIINLWCNTVASLDSTMYIVPEEAEHKDSYKQIEYLSAVDMFSAYITGEDQLFFEVELPENISPGNYDLRFVCGAEEGYITFHLG